MLNSSEDFLFRHDVLLLIFLEDVFLFQNFQSVKLVIFEIADEEHFGVGPFSDNGDYRKVVNLRAR